MPANITLRVLLLGTPAVYIDDQPVQIQRRLLRWMLFYLACQKEMVGRSDLILLFWPDESEDDARRHLREALSKLRAQLPDQNLIITDQDRVGLDPQRFYSDVIEFENLFTQTARVCAQIPAAAPLTQAVHQMVVRAVRLWRSGRFLAGMPLPESEVLSDWQLQISQQYETQRLRLLERLVDHDTASGDTEGAIQWLRAALESDETNETLHYRLLNLLHRQGRSSEALNYCTYLQELFRREGHDELPPALLSLYKKVREAAAQPHTAEDPPIWPALADLQVPFTGRHDLLKALQFAVRRDSPVILFGEAGAGKTRLVRELYFTLKPPPRLLLATARIHESDLPFQPLVDMLRHDIRAEEWQQMNPVWLAPLAQILPELAHGREAVRPPSATSTPENSLLFEALRQLFRFLSARQRCLFFLDNAQWCDSATLAALAYLTERGTFGESGSLVLAARPEAITPALENFLNRPRSDFSVQRLALEPLNAAEVTTLARYVLGEAYSESILPHLERDTGGNPLFLLETLRLMQDYALDAQISSGLDRLPLPSSVHALIRERLQRLTPNDSMVLSMAAIIGHDFSIDLLEETSRLPSEQVVQSLESLAQYNLIRAVSQDRPSSAYAFVHEKIREVLLLDLSPARLRLLHLRVARALEQKYQGQSAEVEARLAGHYEEAGELDASFRHWLKAADWASRVCAGRVFACADVASACQRAEQILMRLDQHAADSSIYQLYRQWFRLGFDQHNPDEIERAAQSMLQFGQARHNPLLIASAYNALAQAAELRMQPNPGLEWLEKGRVFIEQSGDVLEQIEATNRRGWFYMLLGQYNQARHAYENALAAAEAGASEAICAARATSQYQLALLLLISGQPRQAHELAERAANDFDAVYDRAGAAWAISLAAAADSYLGRYQSAYALASRGLQMAEPLGLPDQVGQLHGALAVAALALGDLQGCRNHAQAGLRAAPVSRSPFLNESIYGVLGRLYTFLGDLATARQIYERGMSASAASHPGTPNPHALANQARLGALLAIQGDGGTGLAHIDQALAHLQPEAERVFHLEARLSKAQAWAACGSLSDAESLAEQVRAEASQNELAELELQSELLLARIAMRQRQLAPAVQRAALSAGRAQAMGHLPLEIELRAIWLEATRRGDMTIPAALGQRMRECAGLLGENIQSGELKTLYTICQKAWTKYNEPL